MNRNEVRSLIFWLYLSQIDLNQAEIEEITDLYISIVSKNRDIYIMPFNEVVRLKNTYSFSPN